VWNKSPPPHSSFFQRDLLQRKYVQHVQVQVEKIVPLTKLNKYLNSDIIETEVNINEEIMAVKNSKTNKAT
jgi:hypothetical protein